MYQYLKKLKFIKMYVLKTFVRVLKEKNTLLTSSINYINLHIICLLWRTSQEIIGQLPLLIFSYLLKFLRLVQLFSSLLYFYTLIVSWFNIRFNCSLDY